MIAFALAQHSAEDPIDENHIAENDRQHHERAHQHKDVGRGRRRRLPNRQQRWNDIREIRDQQPKMSADRMGVPRAAAECFEAQQSSAPL
jgi:hypothetical protein